MRTALCVLTYVPVGAPANVIHRLPTAITSLRETGYSGPVYIVDDGSTDPDHLAYLASLAPEAQVVLKGKNGGTARAKNTCLRILQDLDVDLGFIAEDDIEFLQPGWDAAYVAAHQATKIHHFSFTLPGYAAGEETKKFMEVAGVRLSCVEHMNGIFGVFSRKCIQQLGGFRIYSTPWGAAHSHYTLRAYKYGLSPCVSCDIADSGKYFRLNAMSASSVTSDADRERYAAILAKEPKHKHKFYPIEE